MKDIYGFLKFKKVEIIEKTDARVHTTSSEWPFSGATFNNKQQEIIGNRYLKQISARTPPKQLDYSLSISIRLINYHLTEISSS